MNSLFSLLRRSSAMRFFALLGFVFAVAAARAQDPWMHINTDTGADRIRIAVADFKPNNGVQDSYRRAFDSTLFNDLTSAGIFDIVSKGMIPQKSPGVPAEINLGDWAAAPSSASMVAFGNLNLQGGKLIVNGFLDDAKNTQFPQVFAKQYNEAATEDMARQLAHRFADEIIFRLGGGMAGIAESKVYYVKLFAGSKEIWEMDYDGANQHAITNLGSVSLSPRVSPDNSRIAFSTLGRDGFQIKMYSLILGRMVAYSSVGGTNLSPAWSPDGLHLALSSSRTGDPEIWVSDPAGSISHRITNFKGPDVSPSWNPKTGSQIAWISGRSGLPQLYIMDADGSGVQRMTDGGYATSPSWSPNGQFLAFAWNRKYGPGAPGGQDIYVMEIATKRWIQLTHDGGRCDFPAWSPDGRHLVYANSPDGHAEHTRIMSMLADGTEKKALTGSGADMPNWSWH